MPNSVPLGPGSTPAASPQSAPAAIKEIRFEPLETRQPVRRFKRFTEIALRFLAALSGAGELELRVRGYEVAIDGRRLNQIDAWRKLRQPIAVFIAIPESLDELAAVVNQGCSWKQGFWHGRLVGRHEVLQPPTEVRGN